MTFSVVINFTPCFILTVSFSAWFFSRFYLCFDSFVPDCFPLFLIRSCVYLVLSFLSSLLASGCHQLILYCFIYSFLLIFVLLRFALKIPLCILQWPDCLKWRHLCVIWTPVSLCCTVLKETSSDRKTNVTFTFVMWPINVNKVFFITVLQYSSFLFFPDIWEFLWDWHVSSFRGNTNTVLLVFGPCQHVFIFPELVRETFSPSKWTVYGQRFTALSPCRMNSLFLAFALQRLSSAVRWPPQPQITLAGPLVSMQEFHSNSWVMIGGAANMIM